MDFRRAIKRKLACLIKGKRPVCNQKAHRGFRIGKRYFPLCWRCSGILVGVLFAFILGVRYNIWCSVMAVVPLAVDSVAQYKWKIESTNTRRFLTGFICGAFAINK